MKDLTVIIPLFTFNHDVKENLDRALDTIALQTKVPEKVIFAIPSDLAVQKDFLDYAEKNRVDFKNFDIALDVSFSINNENPNIQSLINHAVVNDVETKWFSICFHNDYYGKTWFENVERYIALDKDYSMLVPLVNYHGNDGKFIRIDNAQYWAQSFSNEIGVVDEESLKLMFDMTIYGSVINVKDFIDTGKFKESMKLFFDYEFLLRFVYNSKGTFVIPKTLYTHVYQNDDNLPEEEAKFYWDTALSEYYFTADRNKTFETQSDTEAVSDNDNVEL